MIEDNFLNRASFVFFRLKEMGHSGIFIIAGKVLTIVGTEQLYDFPLNDNEAKP